MKGVFYMRIVLTRCDKCRRAFLENKYKTTKLSYTRPCIGERTFDLCEACLNDLISSLADSDDKPLYIPGE